MGKTSMLLWHSIITLISLYCDCFSSVKTDMKPTGATSKLFIANANKQDSGNYSCSLDEMAITTVSVHVLNGKSYRMSSNISLPLNNIY